MRYEELKSNRLSCELIFGAVSVVSSRPFSIFDVLSTDDYLLLSKILTRHSCCIYTAHKKSGLVSSP